MKTQAEIDLDREICEIYSIIFPSNKSHPRINGKWLRSRLAEIKKIGGSEAYDEAVTAWRDTEHNRFGGGAVAIWKVEQKYNEARLAARDHKQNTLDAAALEERGWHGND